MRTLFLSLIVCALLGPTKAASSYYRIVSPTHGQTFALGSERHQQWMTRGRDHHLALAAEFTNDPYVDRINIREYDDFTFDFPAIRLGPDGRRFFYHAPDARLLPVAERHRGFLGIETVSLLPGVVLLTESPHGFLTMTLVVTTGRAD